jgi:hypothetical protein
VAEGSLERPAWEQIMLGVNYFISNSVLAREGSVFIANAWQTLLGNAPTEKRKTRDEWKPKDWKPTPGKLPDGCDLMPETQNHQKYVADGLAKLANKTFFGVCNDFTWVVTSALVTGKFTGKYLNQAALLPRGTRVEVFGILGFHEDKHLFTVVNRDPNSDAASYHTWGPDCYVVDQWYALQTATKPVKSLTDGPFYDPEFIKWWNATVPGTRKSNAPDQKLQSNFFKSMNVFTAGEYP